MDTNLKTNDSKCKNSEMKVSLICYFVIMVLLIASFIVYVRMWKFFLEDEYDLNILFSNFALFLISLFSFLLSVFSIRVLQSIECNFDEKLYLNVEECVNFNSDNILENAIDEKWYNSLFSTSGKLYSPLKINIAMNQVISFFCFVA